VLDDIPALEDDDPRIEQANSEGVMENYEVKEAVEFKKYVKISSDFYF
jgi:hypothetical protein